MNIRVVELKIEFAEETRLRTHATMVAEVLGSEIPGEEIEPVLMREENSKFAVRWVYERCAIRKEDVDDIGGCIDIFISTIESINKVAPVGKLSSTILRVDWVYPNKSKSDFGELETKYRQSLVKSNELFQNICDSSVIIDMKYGNLMLHHQSGIMGAPQLQEDWRAFRIERGHPSLFVFLTTVVTDKELKQYSSGNMGGFINDSFKLMKSHAEHFGKFMEEIL